MLMPARDDRFHPADSLVFALANLWAYLRHPRLALTSCIRLRRLINFARPTTHGEMIQWRKLFDRNPAFVSHVDKLAAKCLARAVCPDLPAAEVLWEGDDFEQLPAALVVPGHVIKANNGCARNYVPGRGAWPAAVLRRRARRWLARRWARLGEWAYAEVEPRLFVERELGCGRPLVDLTMRAFDGTVALAFVAEDWKTPVARAAYFDPAGNRLRLEAEGSLPLPAGYVLPASFHRARRYAEQLSSGIDHVRVDFMVVGEDIYFNEFTHYTASGYGDEDRLGLGERLLAHWFASIGTSDFLMRPRPWPVSIYQAAFRRHAASWLSDVSVPAAAPAQPAPAP